MNKYTNLNAQMEHLAAVIRQLYIFEDKHLREEEKKFICDFIEEMVSKEKLEDVHERYHRLLKDYIPRIENIEKVAPDIDTKNFLNK